MSPDVPGELESFSEGWIDASRPLHSETPVWPGDPPFTLEQSRDHALVLSSFATTCHVGTHVDAPLHLLRVVGAQVRHEPAPAHDLAHHLGITGPFAIGRPVARFVPRRCHAPWNV